MTFTPASLTTNRLRNPLGIALDPPEFGWAMPGTVGQRAWEIEVYEGDGLFWQSGMTAGAQPFGVRYDGAPLEPRTAYEWRLRLELEDGSRTEWSEPACFETGLVEDGWHARWISAPGTPDAGDTSALYLRSRFDLPAATVVRARAFVSALGWYRLFVNDTDVTGDDLVPRWSPFHEYIEYQAYDVTEAVQSGTNVIGMIVAEGRYRGKLGAFGRPRIYGDRLAGFAQLVIDLADGSTVVVASDGSWRSTTGRTRSADPMTGERADLRVSPMAWLTESGGSTVEVLDERRTLRPEQTERVTSVGELPGRVRRAPSGVQLVDFGQNFSGVVRIRLAGPVGETVRLLYSEVLTAEGELDTDYLSFPLARKAEWFQRDEVVLAGEPVEYQAALTIHGFRYVAIEGPARPLSDEDVTGVVLSTAMEEIAQFSSSDDRLNQLWRNVTWSLRSNFTDTPTDCPTRERSGWTGDIQVFGSTAAQLVDADSYLRRYLRNVALEQGDDGLVPPFVPAETTPAHKKPHMAFAYTSVGWGDVTVMLPWTLYTYYGDETVLREQYASGAAWVRNLSRRARKTGLRRRFGKRVGALEKYIVDTGFNWGEWLRPDEGFLGSMIRNFTGGDASVATAYFANSARLLGQIADRLGYADDAREFAAMAENAKQAWNAAFVKDEGMHIADDRQDDYVRALAFRLLPEEQQAKAAARLAALVEGAGYHLRTGFLSTPLLLETLVDTGYPQHAIRVLLQDTSPSWIAQIDKGATSVWETWEGYNKKGRAIASHNHYAFGAVVRFLHERLAGLAPLEPGYRRIRIAPLVDSGPSQAAVSVRTPYGRAASAWRREGDRVELTIEVPAGTFAEIEVGDVKQEAGPGTHQLTAHMR